MRAGKLRRRIVIQKPTVPPTRGSMGGVPAAWTNHVKAWASINPIVGREYFAAQEHQSETTHKIRMRWQAGITPAMRVYYEDHRIGGDRYFDIESVINIEELNEELVLMCKEDLT